MITRLITVMLLILITGGNVMAAELKAGDKAPAFSLNSSDGIVVNSKDLTGQVYVLYFYPKDDTPGCAKEACSFRDAMPDFRDIGTKVYGISLDNVDSHQKFISKYNLNFPLLADTDHSVAKAYGVLGGLGPVQFAGRVTFIIDKHGNIAKIFKDVKPDGHSKEVLDAVKGLL